MVSATRRRVKSKCPRGQILRSAYSRKSTCIRNVGNPGKGFSGTGKGIGPLRKGDLSQFGYENVASMSVKARHAALTKAIAVYGGLSLGRKLNAVYVYTRNTAPASSVIFKADRDWVNSLGR